MLAIKVENKNAVSYFWQLLTPYFNRQILRGNLQPDNDDDDIVFCLCFC